MLTAQECIEFKQAYHALSEQLGQTAAPPIAPVRMRLALWIVRTGLETSQADFGLLDRLCRDHGAAGEGGSS